MRRNINCILFALFLSIVFVGFMSFNYEGEQHFITDERVHVINNQTMKLFENNNIELQSYDSTDGGYHMKLTTALSKKSLNSIYYVSDTSDLAEVEYDLEYNNENNLLSIVADSDEAEYHEEVDFSPVFTKEGYFDGSILVDGTTINLFDYTDEGIFIEDVESDESEECFFLTATIFGVAVWKIALVATAATVACVTLSNPMYVDSLSRAIDGTLNELSNCINKIVVGGITYALTKANEKAISVAKKQSQKEYYIAIPITEANASQYPNSKVGEMLISNYPITKAQAVSNFKKGIDCYTYTATKAKGALKTAFIFDSIVSDNVTKSGYYPHYHAYLWGKKRMVNGHTLHSFYGDAV